MSGPWIKPSFLVFSPTSLFFVIFFCLFFLAGIRNNKKELISSLKLLVSDGKFLSLHVFQPARGLRASFIGQVSSVYHIHQLADCAAVSITAAPS